MRKSVSRLFKIILGLIAVSLINACVSAPSKEVQTPIETFSKSELLPESLQVDPSTMSKWKQHVLDYMNADPKTILLPYSQIIGAIEALPEVEECMPHAMQLSDSALALNPTSILAIYMQMHCAEEPESKAKYQQEILEISNVLLSSGDGKRKETAIEVRELAEAYALLSILGWYIYDMEIVIGQNDKLIYRFHAISFGKSKFRFFYFENMRLLKQLYSARSQAPMTNRTVSLITMRRFLEKKDPSSLAFVGRNLLTKHKYEEVVEQLQPHYQKSLVLSALLAEALIKLDRKEEASQAVERLELDSDAGFIEGMLTQALLISSITDSEEAFKEINYLLKKVDFLTEPGRGIHLFVSKVIGHPNSEIIIDKLLERYYNSGTSISAVLAAAQALDYYEHHEEQRGLLELLIRKEAANARVYYELGRIYRYGKGTDINESEALKYYQQAAEMGLAEAQVDLGYFYIQGILGLKTDIEAAEHWFKQAAAQGTPKAWHNLAELNIYLGEKENIELAVEYFNNAINAGSFNSICNLGLLYRDNSLIQDLEKSLLIFKTGAQQGHLNCIFDLGYTYEVFLNDNHTSRTWYEQAAELGSDAAMVNLGRFYHNGLGVKKDLSKAMEYYEAAIETGNTIAYVNLGLMYEKGDGVEKNYAKAVGYYQKAVDGGNPQAMHNLGVMYAEGRYLEKDLNRAFAYYQRAAKLGNKYSLFNIANAYRYGRGTDKDIALALDFYQKAFRAGLNDAICQLATLYENHPEYKDLEKALHYRTLAKNKSLPECEQVAFMRIGGNGIDEQIIEISGDMQLNKF